MVRRREEEAPGEEVHPGRTAHEDAVRYAASLTFGEALAFETNGDWPGWRVRGAFWSRGDIPAELRDSAEPDPRRVLTMAPEEAKVWREEKGQWEYDRLAWLRSAAEGVS